MGDAAASMEDWSMTAVMAGQGEEDKESGKRSIQVGGIGIAANDARISYEFHEGCQDLSQFLHLSVFGRQKSELL